MAHQSSRREFLRTVAAGGALWVVGAAGCGGPAIHARSPALISPGCRKSKVKVAKIYLGRPKAHWPCPTMDIEAEMKKYEAEFAKRGDQIADVEFTVNQLVTDPAQLAPLKDRIAAADGILAIHLSMGIGGILKEILALGKPVLLFAAPYSGHEWTGYGRLRQENALLECLLTSDYGQLVEALRPIRAIHHLREAKILNITDRDFSKYAAAVREKFGTEIVRLERDRVIKTYESVPLAEAEAEAARWIAGAQKVVEPPRDEIVRSCRLAIAFGRLLDEDGGTVITADCYGTMWRRLPAYPCIGLARANNMGLGGVCESDLQSAVTFVLLQGLSGKPGFVSDPTMDVSKHAIILAHCMGTPCMDGPGTKPAPYRLRSIMERQEGAVCQVMMRIGEPVTQAILVGTDTIRYFTGTIIETPDVPRGCRTKITVKIDGDAEKLWQTWAAGLHRVTCYTNVAKDLARFCRFKNVTLVNEA